MIFEVVGNYFEFVKMPELLRVTNFFEVDGIYFEFEKITSLSFCPNYKEHNHELNLLNNILPNLIMLEKHIRVSFIGFKILNFHIKFI